MTNATFANRLLAGTALPFLSVLAFASPAAAQGQVNPPPNTETNQQQASPNATQIDQSQSPAPVPNTNDLPDQEPTITVTGTLFRSSTSATVSPITVLTEQSLDQRGINTVQDAIQQLSSNNGPAVTNSFAANGAFAAGASAVSLRGLSTSSTLVLFDGQRAAYYPLADDGTRNFVDLNTIPDDVVERIEVLRDGASSTYGADAIAGVVNIITRRSFNGVRARAEAGISQDGSNPTQRLSLTAGTGDLDTNGINAYVSGFYFHQGATMNNELDAPFNSSDKSGVCQGTACGPNNIINSRSPTTGTLTAFLTPYDVYVQPYNGTTNTLIPGARFQLLNPAAGCRYGPGYTPTAAEIAALPTLPTGAVCTVDPLNEYGTVTPNIERFGGTVRVTARLADNAEGYFMANFQQSTVSYYGTPQAVRAAANTGILFPAFSTASTSAALAPGSAELRLPVYVCPTGVASANGLNTGCTATTPGARLNPNNPFAAQGQLARILGRPFLEPTFTETRSRVYRAAAGVSGTLWGNWDYRVDGTAMHTDLNRHFENYLYINNLLTAIAQGNINLVNPQLNTQAQLDFVAPTQDVLAQSDLYAVQATLGTTLFQIGDRDVQFGFGGAIRYESVNAPSANDDSNGPTQRYFSLNAFGTEGNRTVYSGFFELNVPVLDILEINGSGRYDSYSSGQSAFSPKIGAKFTPIPEIAFRATYSRGFRIPSFAEANALPTTGFVSTNAANFTNTFLAQYSLPGAVCSQATFSQCPAYIRTNSYGQTTLASPDLDPEKSESFTVGAILNPIRNVTLTVDYYDIKKTGAITQPSNSPALLAYYSCTAAQINGNTCPIPAGYNVIPGAPDTSGQFPNASPIVGFVQSQLINSDTIRARGIDVNANVRLNLGNDIRLTSALDVSYILELSTTFPGGAKENYVGTLGNYNLTSGSGTPRVRGSWQNTLEWGAYTITGTLNYVSGYNKSAEDQGGVSGDCGLTTGPYVTCDTPEYFTLDLTQQFRVNDNFTFYFNVLNLLDELPPFDDRATYGNQYYNLVQAGNGIFGRQFRAGVRVNF